MAEHQSLPGRIRRPRPRRAMRRLVIWYRRTGPVINLVGRFGIGFGPGFNPGFNPFVNARPPGPRIAIAVDGMGAISPLAQSLKAALMQLINWV